MAQLLKPPKRFTHHEWTISTNHKCRSTELERQAAERLQNEGDRLMDETKLRTVKSLNDVNKKIDQSIDDINHWRNELEKKHDVLAVETDKLDMFITRMQKALESTEEPLHLTQNCLANREGRKGIDLVHDDIQKELLKELEVQQGSQMLLMKTIEQAKEQLRLNRKAKYRLAKDIKGKFTAKCLDEHCANLKTNSHEIGYVEGVDEVDPNSINHQDWEEYTNNNILNGESERYNSECMRSIIDGVLQQIANDQRMQKEAVDSAFKSRISETKNTKAKLEEHLNKVLKEISNMEDTIREIQLSIEAKQKWLQLAETRTDIRNGRPNIENKRDPAQLRLIDEIGEIKRDMTALGQRLTDCQFSLKGLTRRQLELEDDIQIKANTLFIDEVQCEGIRHSMIIIAY